MFVVYAFVWVRNCGKYLQNDFSFIYSKWIKIAWEKVDKIIDYNNYCGCVWLYKQLEKLMHV